MNTKRMRELAQAMLDGCAREADRLELCNLILAEPEHEGPLTDGELAALGALANAEALAEHLEQHPNDAAKRLRHELESRGVL